MVYAPLLFPFASLAVVVPVCTMGEERALCLSSPGDVKSKFCQIIAVLLIEFRLFPPFCSRLAAECGNAQDQEPANQVSSLHHPDGAAIPLRTTTPSA